ncbi:MAG: cytochrome c [Myxococcales bacterium]|nr:cytochrome c [Myxococcales bacterium]MCB9715535.1 cytochrome c [Myxococcales bacterium]
MRTLASLPGPILVPSIVVLCALGSCGDPPQRFTGPMVLGGQEVSPEVLGRGARVYALYCVSCHAADGSGTGNGSRSFTVPPRDFREADFRYVSGPEGSLPTDADLEHTISHGVPDNGMPAWDGLPAEDRAAVAQYLKTFSKRWAHESPPAVEGRKG